MDDVKRINFSTESIHILQYYLNEMSWSDVILMQSTGLLDKNGVEIFEGDIIKWKKRDIKVIVWDKTKLCNCLLWSHHYSDAWKSGTSGLTYEQVTANKGKSIEIIGNIYTTPELLK